MKNLVNPLRTLLERLEATQEATRDDHHEAMRQAREAFELRLVQAVAYRMERALDIMLGE